MAHPPPPSFSTQADIARRLAEFAPPDRRDRREAEWNDVGFLRHLWRNFDQVAPGVYRSNHPGARRLRGYAGMGIKAVLNLRGELGSAPQRIEAATCAELGIEFHILALAARRAPRRQALLELFHRFDTLPRPFLMHCKSGADRAGLASAFYLLDQTSADLATAQAQLSLRYLHLRRSATGILDHVLDLYGRAQAETGISLRDWVDKAYDRDAAAQSFEASRR